MASSSNSDQPVNGDGSSGSAPKSYFRRTVCLVEWWLVKAETNSEGSRLCIAGFTSREKQAMRVFSSAPIVKRPDVFTLETSDGISIILKGFLNKARSAENGFPSEVSKHFIFGFPSYWKEYSENCMGKETSTNDVSGHNLDPLRPSPCSSGAEDCNDNSPKHGEKVIAEEAHDSFEKDLGSIKPLKEDKLETKTRVEAARGVSSEKTLMENNTISSSMDLKNTREERRDCMLKTSDDHNEMSPLSPCILRKSSKHDNVRNSEKNVELAKQSSNETGLGKNISTLKGLDVPEGRMLTRSVNKLRRNTESDQSQSRILTDEECSNDMPVLDSGKDKEAVATVGFVDVMKSTNLDADSDRDTFKQNTDFSKQDEEDEGYKNKVRRKKVKNNSKKRNFVKTENVYNRKAETAVRSKGSISRSAEPAGRNIRRKLEYVTPEKEDNISVGSAKSLNFNRSRSGRLLMPTLAFWRNERALYDGDRKVMGIDDGLHLGSSTKGNHSEPHKKKRPQ